MGVLGHLTKEERESLWETFEKKLKTGTPVLIGVLNKKFLFFVKIAYMKIFFVVY